LSLDSQAEEDGVRVKVLTAVDTKFDQLHGAKECDVRHDWKDYGNAQRDDMRSAQAFAVVVPPSAAVTMSPTP
jgi:hypothetical protein